MKLSPFTLKNLARSICGDVDEFPYLTGPQLIEFFNKYGFDHNYEDGFPSRWQYVLNCISALNGDKIMKVVIEDTLDPRRYYENDLNYDVAAEKLNGFLNYDGYEVKKLEKFYKVIDSSAKIVVVEKTAALSDEFIQEHIHKCQEKIQSEDYKGAITNARTLLESIFIEIIERHEGTQVKNDGNLITQWKMVRKIMRMEIDPKTLPEYVVQILSGLDSTINGIAALSNSAADRHANKFNTRKHHAKLAVNVTLALSDFLLDSWDFQRSE